MEWVGTIVVYECKEGKLVRSVVASSSSSAALRLLWPGITTRVYVAVELHHFATFTSAGCDAGDTYIERAVRVLV